MKQWDIKFVRGSWVTQIIESRKSLTQFFIWWSSWHVWMVDSKRANKTRTNEAKTGSIAIGEESDWFIANCEKDDMTLLATDYLRFKFSNFLMVSLLELLDLMSLSFPEKSTHIWHRTSSAESVWMAKFRIYFSFQF